MSTSKYLMNDGMMLGTYSPSHFHIHINSNNSIDKLASIMLTSEGGTFIHETIHLLQDLTTTYASTQTCQFVDEIKFFAERARDHNYDFTLPVHRQFSNGTEINLKLNTFRVGELRHFDCVKLEFIECEPNNRIQGVEDVEYLILRGITSSGIAMYPFFFGGYAISENMASIFQRKFQKVNHPCYPYHSVEMLIDLVYPGFGVDPINIFALCDMSLMSTDPGPYLYRTLVDMKGNRFTPASPQEIYDYPLRNCKLEGDIKKGSNSIHVSKDITSFYRTLANHAKEQILGYFTTPELKAIKDFSQKMLDSAQSTRIDNPHFLIEIMAIEEPSNALDELVKALMKTGIPLVSNAKGCFSSFNPFDQGQSCDSQVLLFRAIEQLRNIIRKRVQGCELKDLCLQNPQNNVCEDCDVNPWAMINRSTLCPFAVLLHTWNIPSPEDHSA